MLDCFPVDQLSPLSVTQSTQTVRIEAELVVDGRLEDVVQTRFQSQTWGGTRPKEYRLTGNLGPLRQRSRAEDYVLFQRSSSSPRLFRLTLVRRGTEDYRWLRQVLGANRRYGKMDLDDTQITPTEQDVYAAGRQEEAREQQDFRLFDEPNRLELRASMRVARSTAFRSRLLDLYAHKCTVSGEGCVSPDGRSELEAAHIVPRSLAGTDDARNGLLLNRRLHWAFDNCLAYVDDNGEFRIPDMVLAIPPNAPLEQYHGVALRPPTDPALAPAPEALAWHRSYVHQRLKPKPIEN
ncbi:HNH endonuclease [Pseudohaliea rubra]|uniref:HNH endonuclease n=1 Tax=Pseudohaliea rubra TaxID=475795 RepID=UPI000A04CD28